MDPQKKYMDTDTDLFNLEKKNLPKTIRSLIRFKDINFPDSKNPPPQTDPNTRRADQKSLREQYLTDLVLNGDKQELADGTLSNSSSDDETEELPFGDPR